MQDLDNDDVIDDNNASGIDNGEQQPEDRGDEVNPGATAESLDAVIDDDGETVDGDSGSDNGSAIPRGRFNEVIEERNWLREQLKARQGGNNGDERADADGDSDEPAQPEPFDFDAKERDYMNAVYEGDQDKALEIRREINQQIRAETEGVVQENFQQQTMKDALSSVAAQAVEQYPFLNSESEAADQDAIEMTLSLRQSYEAQGLPPHEALTKAVQKVGPRFAPAGGDLDADGDNRQVDRARRNAQASANQPPSLKGGGVGERAADAIPDVDDMTEEQFDALTEREKAVMRGDVVE